MPWWGWVIIILLVAVGLPIKIRILKKMAEKKNSHDEEDN